MVVPDVEVRGALADRIDGGAIRGANLFHSFSEFNIDEGQRVYFGNPLAVEHIFSRVTGANASNLFGTLGVDGPADLFFINPNGIVFGENASLDIEGAFVGTTSGSFQFADGSEFGAVPAGGGDLLTVSVPLGLQYGPMPTGNVVNDGDLNVGPGQELTLFGDTVVHRGSLSTSGGTVNVLGNQVALLGTATVDVSGATGGGNVFIGGDLQGQGPRPTAQIAYVEPDVTLNASALDSGNGGQVIVWAEDATYFAGAIAARGGNSWGDGGFVEVSGRQFLDYRGQTDTQAPNGEIGTLLLDPTTIVVVADPGETLDLGQVNEFGIPDIGGDGDTELGVEAINAAESNVVLQAFQDITFRAGVDIVAEGVGLTARAGNRIGVFAPLMTNGGDIELIAGDATSGVASEDAIIVIRANVLSDGGDLLLQSSQDALVNGVSVASTELNGQGAGNLLVNVVENFTVMDGGQISVSTFGEGNAGDLIIQANEIELVGVSPIDGFPSGLFASVAPNATGIGGDIDISNVSRLSVLDGAELTASTFGVGNAGSLSIEADRIEVSGSNGDTPSSIAVQVNSGARGNAQTLTLNAQQLLLQDGGQIRVSTFGKGDAGALIIQANEIDLVGDNPIGGNPSGLFAEVEPNATGTGGDINISNVSRLSVSDGARLSATTFGAGNGGTLSIEADRIEVNGSDDAGNPSIITAQVNSGAIGNAQALTLNAQQLLLQDGGRISVSTFGAGNAGDLIIQANEIELIGVNPIRGNPSGLFASVAPTATGTGGDINISNVSRLAVLDGAELSASTLGQGNSGTLSIEADRIEVSGSDDEGNPSVIGAQVGLGAIGNAQTLTLNAQQLLLQEGGQIRVSTFGEGNAGDLIIQANEIDLVGVDPINGFAGGLFADVEFNATGTGGDINISNVSRLSVSNGAQLSASTFGAGNGGTLSIEADRIEVSSSDDEGNPSVITAEVGPGAVGNAQTLTLNAQQLLLQEGGQIRVSTFGEGNAGDLIIQANEIDLVGVNPIRGNPSGLFADVDIATGTGGDINITNVSRLSVSNGAELSASTFGAGNGGTLSIEADRIEVSGSDDEGNSSVITAEVGPGAIGSAQTLTLNAQQLLLQEGGQIRISTFGEGNAGDLIIQANEIDLVGVNPIAGSSSGLFASVESNAIGTGGDINISNVSRLSVLDGARLSAETFGAGNGGTISIEAERIEVSGSDDEGNVSSITAEVRRRATGNAQTLTLNAQQLLLQEGGQIRVSTFGEGNAGDLIIQASDSIALRNDSNISSAVERGATGDANRILLQTPDLALRNGSQISSSTNGTGNPGIIRVRNADDITLDNSQISVEIGSEGIANSPGGIRLEGRSLSLTNNSSITASTEGVGDAGDIVITGDNLEMSDDSAISSSSTFEPNNDDSAIATRQLQRFATQARTTDDPSSNAGNITIRLTEDALLTDSDITTEATAFSGGDIDLTARNIRLRGDSDITTNVQSGIGGGGNITITADAAIAFDDSDILAFAADGQGGNIDLSETPAFFAENFDPAVIDADPTGLDGNDRADINASGGVNGVVTLPDVSFIQNSLNDLPQGVINTESLIANSCVVRNADGSSTFVITGNEGLGDRPGNLPSPHYSLGEVQTVDTDQMENSDPINEWRGDPIIEPQGVYRLPNGELVISHACR